MKKIYFFIAVLTLGVLVSGCSLFKSTSTNTPAVGLANPASVYCEKNDGKTEIVTASDGSEAGLCKFNDGSQCDEWQYFRGECQPGNKNSNANTPGAVGPIEIKIANFAFDRNELTLRVGANVSFVNYDSVSHQIASDSTNLNSGVLQQGQAFSTKFDQAGTYNYHCSIHPSMTGKIIITE